MEGNEYLFSNTLNKINQFNLKLEKNLEEMFKIIYKNEFKSDLIPSES